MRKQSFIIGVRQFRLCERTYPPEGGERLARLVRSHSKGFTRLTRKSLRQALRTREGRDLTREGRWGGASLPEGGVSDLGGP